MGEKLSSILNEAVYEDILWTEITRPFIPQEKVILPELQEIKDTMMERVGIVRNEADLKNQKVWLDTYKAHQIKNLDSYSIEEMTKIFMLIIANLITEAALKRTESRGGHFRSDCPMEDDHHWLNKTIIHKNSRGMESNHEYIETALAT